MKNLIILILILAIGFFTGFFTKKNFSFLQNIKFHKVSQEELISNLTNQANDALDGIVTSVQKETGPIFDKQYLDAMIVSYESSVALSKVGKTVGSNDEIRNLATNVAKDDAVVLAQLKQWRNEWYPETTPTKDDVKNPPFIKK